MLNLTRTVLKYSIKPSTFATSSFILTNRNFSTSLKMVQEIKTLTIFGAGLMGAGIAQVAAQNGIKVGECL